MRDFAAIDFETANNEPTSVCSVGIVIVRDCQVVDSFYSLIKPEPEYYNFWCSQVHGLTEEDTCDAPVFPKVWAQIEPLLQLSEEDQKRLGITTLPLVAHNKVFDENCLKAVFRCYGMDYPDYDFHCTLVKSRRVWPCGHHNLDIIAARCGFDLSRHHHALADAEACAAIAVKLFNADGDPYYMEASDIVYKRLLCIEAPIKAADLAELMRMERKVIDSALKRLKEEGKVECPKRGYYKIAGKE